MPQNPIPPSPFLATALAAFLLVACTEPDGSPGRGILHGGTLSKSDVGTAAGVIGGGVLGSTIGGGTGKVAATIGGALLGGILGNSIGTSLDNADMDAYDRASQRAMNTGYRQSWKNPQTGHYGSISPRRKYRNEEGWHCREYTQTIHIDGNRHSGHGTACREEDGTWKIME